MGKKNFAAELELIIRRLSGNGAINGFTAMTLAK
jgi:hypothetical protein